MAGDADVGAAIGPDAVPISVVGGRAGGEGGMGQEGDRWGAGGGGDGAGDARLAPVSVPDLDHDTVAEPLQPQSPSPAAAARICRSRARIALHAGARSGLSRSERTPLASRQAITATWAWRTSAMDQPMAAA